jgi:hypothetical protein
MNLERILGKAIFMGGGGEGETPLFHVLRARKVNFFKNDARFNSLYFGIYIKLFGWEIKKLLPFEVFKSNLNLMF